MIVQSQGGVKISPSLGIQCLLKKKSQPLMGGKISKLNCARFEEAASSDEKAFKRKYSTRTRIEEKHISIERDVCSGEFGTVYKGKYTKRDSIREVALKTVEASKCSREEYRYNKI